MKKIFVFLLMLAIALPGCKPEEGSEKMPKLILNEKSVSALAEGGTYKVTYSLENPIEETSIEIEVKNGEWLKNFDMDTPGVISFYVEPNTQNFAREAKVVVKYSTVSTNFTVTQVGDGGKSCTFTIQVDEVTYNSVTYSVVPSDKNVRYMSMVVEKSYFDEFASDKDYFEDDMAFLREQAEEAGMTFDDFLKQVCLSGDKLGMNVPNLKSEKTYYAYAYGITESGDLLTAIAKQDFTTDVEPQTGDFILSVDVDGPMASIKAESLVEDQWFVFDAIKGGMNLELATIIDEYQYYLDAKKETMLDWGFSMDDFFAQVANKGMGEKNMELDASSEYTAFAAKINSEGVMDTELSIRRFDTGDVEPSDNQITFEIYEQTENLVKYSITTTNDDPYAYASSIWSAWEGMSDEEILATLFRENNFLGKTSKGSRKGTFRYLEPDTEYVVFIFGCYGNKPTTPLQKVIFKTLAPAPANVTIDVVCDKYFDGTAVADTYGGYDNARGKAVLPVDVVTTGEVSKFYYAIYDGDYTDEESAADNVIIYNLENNGGKTTAPFSYYISYDKVYTALGVALDAAGKKGPVFRKKVIASKNGVSPVEEFTPSKSNVFASMAYQFDFNMFNPKDRIIKIEEPESLVESVSDIEIMSFSEFVKWHKSNAGIRKVKEQTRYFGK